MVLSVYYLWRVETSTKTTNYALFVCKRVELIVTHLFLGSRMFEYIYKCFISMCFFFSRIYNNNSKWIDAKHLSLFYCYFYFPLYCFLRLPKIDFFQDDKCFDLLLLNDVRKQVISNYDYYLALTLKYFESKILVNRRIQAVRASEKTFFPRTMSDSFF